MPPFLQTGGRTLRPALLLRRLRPLHLERMAHYLGDFGRRAQVLNLIQTHFPDTWQGEWSAHFFWFEVYCDFLRAVEAAGWFEPDWDTLQMWEQHWMEYGDDENMGFDTLVEYLQGIPVLCFGWDVIQPEFELGDPGPIQDYPALELLRFLILGTETGREPSERIERLLESLDFYRLDNYDCNAAHDRLVRAAERQKPPWGWLGEMADFACDRSGNIILDTTLDPHEPWPCQWTWDRDLEAIKAAWGRARPTVEHFREFVERVRDEEDLEYIAITAMGSRKKRRRK